jgi:FkbM family methyltransferase
MAKLNNILLNFFRFIVRQKLIRRGHGWLLNKLWGGKVISIDTVLGEMTVPIDSANNHLIFFGEISNEKYEMAFIKKFSSLSKVMVDVGAHVGFYSLLMHNEMKNTKLIYAFEPDPRTFPFLYQNTQNKSGIFIYNIGVSNIEGIIPFYCSEVTSFSSSVRKVGTTIYVNATTLDSVFIKLNLLDSLDFLKIDVEGGELAVIQGSKKILSSSNPPCCMVEICESINKDLGISFENILHQINDYNNYHAFYFNKEGKFIQITDGSKREEIVNIIFVPQQRLNQVLMLQNQV